MKKMNLQLFAGPTSITSGVNHMVTPINVTTQDAVGSSMAPTMKTFYDTALLENAREKMVFTQLGKKQPMKGKTVEWRKFNTFGKALTPLTEGVIPTGQNFGMTVKDAEITQHGDYVAISDRLELESYDDVIFGATEEMGAAEGETFDTLTRNILVAQTMNTAMYAPNGTSAVTSKNDITSTCVLTPDLVAKIATALKKSKAPTFEGNTYVMVIHPSQAYDLRATAEWKEFHKYADVAPIFNGEIGTLHGIRFIESTNVAIENVSGTAVYRALAMGKDAFGVLDPAGEGMEMIIKDRHEAGGPLDQFSTIGYKFCHGAKVLYEERIIQVVTGSAYSSSDSANYTAA